MWNAYAAYADYYAALLLLVVFIVILVKKDIYTFAERVLLAMIAFSILILVAEGTTYLIDGRPGNFAYRINYLFNTFLFLAAPVMGMLWGIYIDYKLHGSHQRLRRHLYYLPLAVVGAVLSLINIFTPILFSIDSTNVFRREWAIYINMGLLYILFLYLLVRLLAFRPKLQPHVFFGLLMLMVFPAIGGTLQMIWYGVASMFSMLALGLLTAYIAVETVAASKDALTKLFDRGKVLDYLADLIERDIAFSLCCWTWTT